MIRLNHEQQLAVDYQGNVVITACPGSGKTRVLTARGIRGILELSSKRERVVALTFTNRAADEIHARLDHDDVDAGGLWAGTIHAFALDWILRPYAPYCESTRYGFTVADEYFTDRLLKELKREEGLDLYTTIATSLNRDGQNSNWRDDCRRVFEKYKLRLRETHLIDYDDVLFLAYRILKENSEIAATLGSIIRLICVDEVQDVQDLQFAILSAVFKASSSPPVIFLVGDANQSIYESLGATTKTPEESATEFGLPGIGHRELTGNYRTTQRMIDFYSQFRPNVPKIKSLADYADEAGIITFHDQTIPREELASAIAALISSSIDAGIPPQDICVLAPQWWQVQALARRLVEELPNTEFDAPGLSPLHSLRENFWFKVSRLFLTRPAPSRTRTRMRWANEILADFRALADAVPSDGCSTPRRLLRVINSITSGETDGPSYLRDVFSQLLQRLGTSLESNDALKETFDTFFNKVTSPLESEESGMPADVDGFRRLFCHPSGVVVSTCHGVKGEEYETVIALGLLKGYVPNWDEILHAGEQIAAERESKLLYVICSRAKRRLHLIAENGRMTKKGNPYETAPLLRRVRFEYDRGAFG
jgi:DNA helicase-2/ATP-dependent DNA helicase PcrA